MGIFWYTHAYGTPFNVATTIKKPPRLGMVTIPPKKKDEMGDGLFLLFYPHYMFYYGDTWTYWILMVIIIVLPIQYYHRCYQSSVIPTESESKWSFLLFYPKIKMSVFYILFYHSFMVSSPTISKIHGEYIYISSIYGKHCFMVCFYQYQHRFYEIINNFTSTCWILSTFTYVFF